MKIYADQGVNQRKLRDLKNTYGLEIVQAQGLEQKIRIANDVPKAFTIGLSVIGGGDYLAGDDIEPVKDIIGSSTVNDRIDVGHIYAAYHAGCSYFVTNNPKSFIYKTRADKTSTKRLQLEEALKGLRVVTISELEQELILRL